MTVIDGRKRYGPDTDDPDTCAHCKNKGWWQGRTQPYYCECPIGQEMKRTSVKIGV